MTQQGQKPEVVYNELAEQALRNLHISSDKIGPGSFCFQEAEGYYKHLDKAILESLPANSYVIGIKVTTDRGSDIQLVGDRSIKTKVESKKVKADGDDVETKSADLNFIVATPAQLLYMLTIMMTAHQMGQAQIKDQTKELLGMAKKLLDIE